MRDVHRAGGLQYRLAGPADDPVLRALLRDNPMQGWVRLSFEREPDYFAAEGLMGESQAVLAETPDARPVGMYHHAWLPLHVNGQPRRLGYLGGLRVQPGFRHRARVLRHGYASVRVLLPPPAGVPGWRFTSLASDNLPARRLLEAGLAGLPRYRPVGELVTLALPAARGRPLRLFQPARRDELAELAVFHARHAAAWQFGPHLDPAWLARLDGGNGLVPGDFLIHRRAGEIAACLAVWDQRACKQTRVQGYRPPLDRLRPLWNAWAGLTGRLALPPAGRCVEAVHLAFAVLPEAEPALARALLAEALGRVAEKSGRLGVLALAAGHPLLPALRRAWRPTEWRSMIETVAWPDDPEPDLDGRPPQPEAALL